MTNNIIALKRRFRAVHGQLLPLASCPDVVTGRETEERWTQRDMEKYYGEGTNGNGFELLD